MSITLNDFESIRTKYIDEKIVLTSGTFDLFHVGHLNYLENVKHYGDILIVLLSGDNRVKSRKGLDRPIISETDRSRILESLKIVDYVFIDPSTLDPDETDPIHLEIIQKLKPDYYITDGPDPRFINIIEESKFIILDRLNPEPSTTSIIERIVGIA